MKVADFNETITILNNLGIKGGSSEKDNSWCFNFFFEKKEV